ncbi:hypothetical protein [Polaromonas sp.]|uniref:hypothetical protein n=1 Tax=Polaromonas sp. TaxID=1869339 RepID=UPI002FCB0300
MEQSWSIRHCGGLFMRGGVSTLWAPPYALEPDSQNSFVANHVLAPDANALLRVMQPLAE